MIELRYLDIRHFVIKECSPLANGCATKCVCIGLMLFRYLSCLGAIICDINIIGFVSVCMKNPCRFDYMLSNGSLGVHEPKWASHVKRPSDVAQSLY